MDSEQKIQLIKDAFKAAGFMVEVYCHSFNENDFVTADEIDYCALCQGEIEEMVVDLMGEIIMLRCKGEPRGP